MAYSVTSAQMYQEMMFTLIETPVDGSAEPSSGLYTRTEIIARINYRVEEFNKRTGVIVANNVTQTATSGQRDVAAPSDVIDYLEVSYNSPTYGYTTVPKGSVYEADLFISNEESSADTPTIYCIEDAPVLSISLIPPPNANNNVRYCYLQRQAQLPSPPDTTVINIPDDLTPFIKYGALADLFGKSGQAYDPFRQQICLQLYEMGIELARAWVSGSQS